MICSSCQKTFTCDNSKSCWCTKLPEFLSLSNQKQSCLCPKCLSNSFKQFIEQSISEQGLTATLEKTAQYYDDSALLEHFDYEIEDGYYVFSKWFLLKRNSCCGSGCRNCPYPS